MRRRCSAQAGVRARHRRRGCALLPHLHGCDGFFAAVLERNAMMTLALDARPSTSATCRHALASTRGWLELLVTLLCVALAWAIDRRARQACASARDVYAHVPRQRRAHRVSAARRRAARTSHRSRGAAIAGAPFFLDIATPLLIALAVIRMLVYGLRRLFPSQAWLPASEVRDRHDDLGAGDPLLPRRAARDGRSARRDRHPARQVAGIAADDLHGRRRRARHAGRDAVDLRADRAAARARNAARREPARRARRRRSRRADRRRRADRAASRSAST